MEGQEASEIDRLVGSRPSFVIVSGYHDYRSKRKADLHFIADELKERGEVSFLSLRYSYLTRYKEDPRHDLWDRANEYERVDGVGCYLWRTPIHPFRLPRFFSLIENAVFAGFSRHLPKAMRVVIERADIVLVESGISIIYIPLIKRLNPKVRVIYMASDSLDAIGQAGAIKDAFKSNAASIDSARVPSPYLARDIPREISCYYIPHGIDKTRFERIGRSPFAPGSLNAVSVGSMLFDPSFFETAARLFPNITFHVIGSGYAGAGPDNVRYYLEMPFEKTLPFLKHSTFAVAPYGHDVDAYLTHTSMKLMQYNYLGVPAVCPDLVAGEGLGRFGYTMGDRYSIKSAIEGALDASRIVPYRHLNWGEVTAMLLEPKSYEDTWLT
jgi:2-beta-glucuronyltransferase